MKENYNMAADAAENHMRAYMQERMKEKGITVYRLSQLVDVAESTLHRWFSGDSKTTLATFLKICGALQLNPYLVPAEDDPTERQRIHFN